jgi:hypothetical protein
MNLCGEAILRYVRTLIPLIIAPVSTYEMLVTFYQTTLRNFPDDSYIQN